MTAIFDISDNAHVEVGGDFVTLVNMPGAPEVILTIDEARRLLEALQFAVLAASSLIPGEA